MIVHSIRLRNIKSYGEGADGTGVTIFLEPGTNRIAGKNGHGKTTLIEALGYGLFLTEPIFEERLQLETYFLRAGTKAAEIDVTFSHHGELLRVERGLGSNSKRRTKVVQIDNGSTCAEGETEVSAFLCRLFDLPNPDRVSELFWKLIGVRQGRLTWPFDSTPGEAKKFFEPLLDVAVFRDCFDSLKPALDEFAERVHEQQRVRAGIEERIRERSDSVERFEEKRRQLAETEARLQAFNRARKEASEALSGHEAAQAALRAAEIHRNAARETLSLCRQKREDTEKQLRESLEAAEIIAATASGFRSFEDAEKELQALRARQVELHRLESEMADAEKRETQFDGKSVSAISQAEVFGRQRQSKEAERSNIRNKADALRDQLNVSQPEFDRQKNLANRAARSISELSYFVRAVASVIADGGEILKALKEQKTILAAKDVSAFQTAGLLEESASERFQLLSHQLAAAKAEHEALATQLQQIAGGICPFLKEQCRQFDPSKVEGDLKEKSTAVARMRVEKGEAEAVFRAAQRTHEQWRIEDRELAAGKSRVEQQVVSFSSAFERLTWVETTEKANELRRWIPQIDPMPDRAKPAFGGTAIETFEAVYEQNASYASALTNWWRQTEGPVQQRIDWVIEEGRRRTSDQCDEANSRALIQRLESEIATLAVAENDQRQAAAAFRKDAEELKITIASLDERRRALAFVPDKIDLLEESLEEFRSDYQRFLGSKPSADQRISRETALVDQKEREHRLASELEDAEGILFALNKNFDEAALAAARLNFQEMTAAAATESVHRTNALREAEREEIRFRQWEEARARRDEIDRAIRRLKNAIQLTELARFVLRDSAPIVAQHLCDRIAANAQRIFNRINHDPVEVKWDAVPRYSLRAIPGDRRFAMLSGGEQTKLALAMTLAMIQEFSGLRFCIFDEPTYGVDAESRDRLGDALLQSQRAANLEQLILVSHDDAFDGKIEHTIFLRKSATGGSEVVL
jgi:DNA repair protein SbcC/Rad50